MLLLCFNNICATFPHTFCLLSTSPSRVGFYVSTFQSLAGFEEKFHKEISRVRLVFRRPLMLSLDKDQTKQTDTVCQITVDRKMLIMPVLTLSASCTLNLKQFSSCCPWAMFWKPDAKSLTVKSFGPVLLRSQMQSTDCLCSLRYCTFCWCMFCEWSTKNDCVTDDRYLKEGFVCLNGFCRGESGERPEETQNEMEREKRSTLEERQKEKS